MHLVELIGGPYDGQRPKVDALLGTLNFHEQRDHPTAPNIGKRLLAGERIPASELEFPGVIVHVYSRDEPIRNINGAVVYRYVAPKRKEPAG
jgi:hypothetical protein